MPAYGLRTRRHLLTATFLLLVEKV